MMKTFSQFFESTKKTFYELETHNWSGHDHELWKDKKYLRPAIQNIKTKEVYIGKPGETHEDVKDRHGIDYYYRNHNMGFYHTKTKEFHPNSAIDSTDLMTKVQRMRKFGTE